MEMIGWKRWSTELGREWTFSFRIPFRRGTLELDIWNPGALEV